jgi:hypothetical protein
MATTTVTMYIERLGLQHTNTEMLGLQHTNTEMLGLQHAYIEILGLQYTYIEILSLQYTHIHRDAWLGVQNTESAFEYAQATSSPVL